MLDYALHCMLELYTMALRYVPYIAYGKLCVFLMVSVRVMVRVRLKVPLTRLTLGVLHAFICEWFTG